MEQDAEQIEPVEFYYADKISVTTGKQIVEGVDMSVPKTPTTEVPVQMSAEEDAEQIIQQIENVGMSVPQMEQLVEQNQADFGVPEETNPVQISADEEAAMKFTRLLPYVTKLSNALPSKGGLVRVMTAMAEFPLAGRKPRLLNEQERQLFAIIQELQGYKSTVLASFIKKQAELEQIQQTATQAVAETEQASGGNEKV